MRRLRDVDNALAVYRTDETRAAALDDAEKAERSALELARDRYRKGLSPFLDVLDAERQVGGAAAGGAGRVADDDRSGRALQGAGWRMADGRPGAGSGYARGDIAAGADGPRTLVAMKRPGRDIALTGTHAKTAANRRR